MSYLNPFTQPGNWYRGNLHCHTTESDGMLTPVQRCAAYRQAGYDFLAITDHRKVTDVAHLSTPDFLVLSGSELHPRTPADDDYLHIVALDVHQEIDSHLPANEVIAAINAQGGLAVLCHPYWCGFSLLDLQPLQGYFAMEVFNGTCTGIGKENSESTWDDLLDRVGPVLGLAVDDTHHDTFACFAGWIMLKAPALTVDDVKTALHTGAYYSTTGPQFHDITITPVESTAPGDYEAKYAVTVTCSPVESVAFKGQRYYGWREFAPAGELLTTATFRIPAVMKYLRLEITDPYGKRAWSNPFYLS